MGSTDLASDFRDQEFLLRRAELKVDRFEVMGENLKPKISQRNHKS